MYETQQTTIISIIITSPDNPSGIFYVSLTVNSKLEFLTISVKILDFGIKTWTRAWQTNGHSDCPPPGAVYDYHYLVWRMLKWHKITGN